MPEGSVNVRETLNFIDGQHIKGKLGRTFDNVYPVDQTLVSRVYEAGREEVDAAVMAA